MKKIAFILLITLIATSVTVGQELKLEQLAERLSEKAQRLAERIERQAEALEYHVEANAPKWEAKAERLGRQLDQQWSRDWRINLENLPDRIVISDEPDGVFLGIESTDISIEKAKALGFENPYGRYVSRVMSNSAAASAGLLPFDYIYGANDQRTSNNQDLADILEDFEPGDEVTLYFIRKGEKHTVSVRLGSYEE